MEDFKAMVPTTALNLLTCTVKLSMNQKKGIKNCFEVISLLTCSSQDLLQVISLQSRWYFQAESQSQMMEWVESIQEVCHYAKVLV